MKTSLLRTHFALFFLKHLPDFDLQGLSHLLIFIDQIFFLDGFIDGRLLLLDDERLSQHYGGVIRQEF
jgi:hypothetical protein